MDRRLNEAQWTATQNDSTLPLRALAQNEKRQLETAMVVESRIGGDKGRISSRRSIGENTDLSEVGGPCWTMVSCVPITRHV